MADDEREYMLFCPDGNEILGTNENIGARAEIASFWPTENGFDFEYEGGSEIFYDTEETVQEDGEDTFLCTDGTAHKRSTLALRVKDEDGEWVAPTKELGLA